MALSKKTNEIKNLVSAISERLGKTGGTLAKTLKSIETQATVYGGEETSAAIKADRAADQTYEIGLDFVMHQREDWDMMRVMANHRDRLTECCRGAEQLACLLPNGEETRFVFHGTAQSYVCEAGIALCALVLDRLSGKLGSGLSVMKRLDDLHLVMRLADKYTAKVVSQWEDYQEDCDSQNRQQKVEAINSAAL